MTERSPAVTTRAEELVRRRDAVVPRGVFRFGGATADSAEGAVIRDADGRELIDLACGIGVTSSGHCPAPVVAAIRAQAGKLLHACIHVATYEPYVALCERLVGLFPHGDGAPGSTRALLLNTGAEAVENAVKIARHATGRQAVICFTEAFHGRTLLALSLTSKTGYKLGMGPFAPEVYRLPFPNAFRYGRGMTSEVFLARQIERLQQSAKNLVAPNAVACAIVEVVQGEGGFSVLHPDYARALRAFCDAHGIVLIFDEVQSGFGRTGTWAAWQHGDVVPDMTTFAKAMGAGLPIAAVVGRAELLDACPPGTLGGTYGGNPVAAAAALANIDFIEEHHLLQKAVSIGERIAERFERLRARSPLVADVRGIGAMRAIVLCHDGDPQKPATAEAKAVVEGCLRDGVLVITAGTDGNVIRLLPPLTISEERLDRALEVLSRHVLAQPGN